MVAWLDMESPPRLGFWQPSHIMLRKWVLLSVLTFQAISWGKKRRMHYKAKGKQTFIQIFTSKIKLKSDAETHRRCHSTALWATATSRGHSFSAICVTVLQFQQAASIYVVTFQASTCICTFFALFPTSFLSLQKAIYNC